MKETTVLRWAEFSYVTALLHLAHNTSTAKPYSQPSWHSRAIYQPDVLHPTTVILRVGNLPCRRQSGVRYGLSR
jgi:hypothetical protein